MEGNPPKFKLLAKKWQISLVLLSLFPFLRKVLDDRILPDYPTYFPQKSGSGHYKTDDGDKRVGLLPTVLSKLYLGRLTCVQAE